VPVRLFGRVSVRRGRAGAPAWHGHQDREQDATDRPQLTLIEQVLSLSELCAHLQVPAQTIYDLRSQGRGPRGFRVGRELRFRISEVEAWLERMEQDDERRHEPGRL
jgi:excisionase family DNA binding protein